MGGGWVSVIAKYHFVHLHKVMIFLENILNFHNFSSNLSQNGWNLKAFLRQKKIFREKFFRENFFRENLLRENYLRKNFCSKGQNFNFCRENFLKNHLIGILSRHFEHEYPPIGGGSPKIWLKITSCTAQSDVGWVGVTKFSQKSLNRHTSHHFVYEYPPVPVAFIFLFISLDLRPATHVKFCLTAQYTN